MREFNKMLKKLRNSYGLTQEELASKLNLSRGQIKNYENGFEPDLETLDRIASYFNVPVDVLLNRNIKHNTKIVENTLIEIQQIIASMNEEQREDFCKKLLPYARFLDKDKKM
ncbi:helix-turn-helix transcriptional regulator [Bacillus thuringiensis]|uniref:MerR family transcriptional regulator n=4 Tax=Bacillus cereus group TaxID=86661 RepID=A0A9W4A1N1_BACTO|nr:helix-turn-helix transcriptional regulator [Bacillus thuringiensis]EEM37981.1 Transcriptional regulator, MerR [Bacillus thuringiensis serovar sotto str. T04001]KXY33049.1 XRE family transcriptional regulator [Bacillus cereus]OUB79369.1 transcriptional regulator [Bacillus thuringiensis serovar zhaodongensis]BAR87861.1 merR family transcriptional regulator [Bacillus thuringiensis serovar tolworthi]AMR88395.1 transcriptional regulator [Bacillus thuringiensis]